MSRLTIFTGTCALVVAIGWCGGAGAGVASKQWAPLDGVSIIDLYAGKTWIWKNGAAYFAPDGRFKARSRSKNQLTEGLGTWEAGDNGVMCFDAAWRPVPSKGEEASAPAVKTCFEHLGLRGAIAQRKLPDGIWYFFRHAKPRKTGEVFKLRRGDHTQFAR
jgi:Protein of unknown function (DUF995)